MARSIFLASCLFLIGCGQSANITPAANQTLIGVVSRKGWSKSPESWNAGGDEYYVIKPDAGSTPIDQLNPDGEILLIASDKVPQEGFAAFIGKKAECLGHFDPGKPFIPPKGSIEQMPVIETNELTGEDVYPMQGTGFNVIAIK